MRGDKNRKLDRPVYRAAPAVMALLMLLTACQSFLSPTPGKEADQFATLVDVVRMNQDFEVTIPEAPLVMFERYVITALVMNRSTSRVHFALDYGVRLFICQKRCAEWQEIRNLTSYRGDGIILEPRTSGFSLWVVPVPIDPELPLVVEPTVLRVVLVGELLNEGTDGERLTGGYADVNLYK